MILALLVPFLTIIGLTRRADAQLALRDTWAVVEFADKTGKSLGKTTAEYLNTEISKLNRFDMALAETIDRVTGELGYQSPVSKPEELMRLGQSLQATTIVSGELVDARVIKASGGKRADVKLRIVVRDVASGLAVNGAALTASSAVRSGDVEDATLVDDALKQAAFQAVQVINSNTLPKATVLNTVDRSALINRGARSGFTSGQEVVVTRGREQVASGRVSDVEPDSAFIKVDRQIKGVQPGDRVTVIFRVPELKSGWSASGTDVVRQKKSGNASGVITVLLVLGLAAFLLGNGRGANNNTVSGLTATLLPPANESRLAVQLNWRPDGFVKEPYRYQWQIWRNDVGTGPVMIADGRSTSAVDDGLNTVIAPWYDMIEATPGICNSRSGGGASATPTALISGVPYQYSIELIYRTSVLDSPDTGGSGSSGGTTGGGTGTGTGGGTTGGGTTGGGTTGGGTTGGGTGGGTTGGGTTGGGTSGSSSGGDNGYCYGISPRVAMNGTVTPFRQPTLSAPDDGVTLAVPTVFRFESMRRAGSVIPIEYVLQLSPDSLFSANNTQTVSKFVDTAAVGTVSTPGAVNILTAFPNASELYWRVGVRNANESSSYTFSGARKFKRPVNPPNP